MKIVILLARKLKDYPTPQAMRLPGTNYAMYPECQKHATDQIRWLIDQIKANFDISIVTGSEHIVNFLGHATECGIFKPGDVEVRIYEQKELKHTCTYDANGVLVDWPFGWFLPDIELIDDLKRHFGIKEKLP